jgi:hypothetical protein
MAERLRLDQRVIDGLHHQPDVDLSVADGGQLVPEVQRTEGQLDAGKGLAK